MPGQRRRKSEGENGEAIHEDHQSSQEDGAQPRGLLYIVTTVRNINTPITEGASGGPIWCQIQSNCTSVGVHFLFLSLAS
jgi:hypothetical protein